ncbi:SGNH/GDSL hydrolase family protein [Anatilimnocola floriformis]|uniref:SGNH/GDSL hydrolase family protein n=1 Tax=Anatilimnocola floriformis TaxID=2948575 RepID=UPI0020C32923|nr:SGNH/GDSL hydrolase family protein [Anatilimnocola floriformis]
MLCWFSSRLRTLAAFAFFLTLAISAASADEFFFKDGDRVMFLGDSITEQHQYTAELESYLTTRFPKWRLSFLNSGIGGDSAGGGAGRFKTHVLDEKPTAVTINFGMNDGGYGKFNQGSCDNFIKNTEKMLDAAKAAGVRVALISPNAVDRRYKSNGAEYLETQKEFYAPLAKSAEKYGIAFADQYTKTRAAFEKMEADKADNVKPFGDGFHTSPPGGLQMAHAILTGLKAPAVVSDVTIDVPSSKISETSCKVTGLAADPTGVEFTRLDEALPMPLEPDYASLLPYLNNLKDLNWYGLKVTGLTSGKYSVVIDGVEVAQHTAEELAQGVNLGNVTKGPVYAQAKKVRDAIGAKNKIVHDRFRNVVMYNAPEWLADVAAERKAAVLQKKSEQIAAAQASIYEAVQPVKHQFAVKAVK